MPTYDYFCKSCEEHFSKILPMSKYNEPQQCTHCGEKGCGRAFIKAPNMVFRGDDWSTKNERIKRQMKAKNKKLTARQNEMKRDAPNVSLAPNVDGERVDSWTDAQKLAKSKGKNTESYEKHIQKEKKGK